MKANLTAFVVVWTGLGFLACEHRDDPAAPSGSGASAGTSGSPSGGASTGGGAGANTGGAAGANTGGGAGASTGGGAGANTGGGAGANTGGAAGAGGGAGAPSCVGVECGEHEECVLEAGEPACRCLSGYAKTQDSDICENVDECAEGSDTCEGSLTCLDTPGSYRCVLREKLSNYDGICDKWAGCLYPRDASLEVMVECFSGAPTPPYVLEEVEFQLGMDTPLPYELLLTLFEWSGPGNPPGLAIDIAVAVPLDTSMCGELTSYELETPVTMTSSGFCVGFTHDAQGDSVFRLGVGSRVAGEGYMMAPGCDVLGLTSFTELGRSDDSLCIRPTVSKDM